jgi:hypothetical protein
MKMILILAAIVGGSLTLAFVLSAIFISPTREGRANILVNATPNQIVGVLQDVKAQSNWREDVAEVTISQNGWTETTARGQKIDFRWKVLTPQRAELAFSSQAGFSGNWMAEFQQTPQGTEISVIETATIENPFARLMFRIFFDPAAFSKAYLGALKAEVERKNG